jgi:hypothetical protein
MGFTCVALPVLIKCLFSRSRTAVGAHVRNALNVGLFWLPLFG